MGAWGYPASKQAIAEHRDCIFAVFAGHDHDGNQFYDEDNNIMFLTFKAALETRKDSSAFAVCDLRLEETSDESSPRTTEKLLSSGKQPNERQQQQQQQRRRFRDKLQTSFEGGSGRV